MLLLLSSRHGCLCGIALGLRDLNLMVVQLLLPSRRGCLYDMDIGIRKRWLALPLMMKLNLSTRCGRLRYISLRRRDGRNIGLMLWLNLVLMMMKLLSAWLSDIALRRRDGQSIVLGLRWLDLLRMMKL